MKNFNTFVVETKNKYIIMKPLFTKLFTMICLSITTMTAWSQLNFKPANAGNFSSTWSALSGSSTSISMANMDNANSSATSIGFNFDYNGTTYTDFIVNTNGFIKLGTSAPSSNALFYNSANAITGNGALSSTNNSDADILAVFNHDLEQGKGTADISYEVTGSSPDRVCTIQWSNFRDKTTNPAVQFDDISFQVKLFETSNKIQFVYGDFTTSGNAVSAKFVGVGIKGSSNATNDVIAVTKASATVWSAASFLQGHYTGNAHNVRNTTKPDKGRTYEFYPNQQFDISITNLYTLGKMPIPFAVPQPTEVRLFNAGTDTFGNFMVYLKSVGTNNFLDSQFVSTTMQPNAVLFLTFTNFDAQSLGMDTVIAWTSNSSDMNKNNDSKQFNQEVNLNSFSYSEAQKGPIGGIGFNGVSGDFVAKFHTAKTAFVNQIKVNFTVTGQSVKVGIWSVNTNTGAPGSVLWTSSAFNTNGGLSVVSVNPAVSVNGDFFVGVLQTGTVNVGFAYQAESPIRDSVFYYTAPTGNTAWTDFKVGNGATDFRFMIEPRVMIARDMGVIKLTAPVFDTCMGSQKMDMIYQVQNLGSDTLNLNVDSFTIYSTVVTPNFDTLTFPIKTQSVGVLYPNDTMNITVSDTLNMLQNGDYYFWASVRLPGDSNYINDTLDIIKMTSTNPVPVIEFVGGTLTLCLGDTAILSAGQSSGVIFQWYNAAKVINGATDTVFYATLPGDYYCEVTSGLGCSLFSDTITVKSHKKIIISPTQTASGICSGDSVLIIDIYRANYVYQWYYNGNPISGATDTAIYAKQAGDYSLEVTDTSTGCTESSGTYTVSSSTSPTASMQANGTTKFCMGDSVQLDATGSQNANFYKWFLNGNLITGASQSTYYAMAAGDYTVQVINNSGCNDFSNAVKISVDSLPDATISASSKTTICDGDDITLSIPSVSGNTYQWYESTKGIITGSTGNTYNTIFEGDYYCTIMNSNGCKNTSAVISVIVIQSPYSFVKQPSTSSTCPGDSILLNATTLTGATYQWQYNGNDISGATDSMFYAKLQGDYSVKVANTNGCTSVSINSISLFFTGGPDPKVSYSGSNDFCEGDSLMLTVTSSSPQSFQWRKNGVDISGETGQIYIAKASGKYSCFVVNTLGCSGASSDTTVTVNPKPVPTITRAGNILSSTTATGWSYQWYLGTTAISGATSKDYSPPSTGVYMVTVTDANGCVGSSSAFSYIGIAFPAMMGSANIWPNPSTGEFNLVLNLNNNQRVSLKVVDMLGKTVLDMGVNNLQKGINNININLNEAPKGVYFLQFNTNDNKTIFKLIKE
ncbi:MAG: T9SS type A sorting domain-containing protein [Bacteroidota bacterium]|nr:T9SS type A sorting domain-containing protein [Bacteroidota bacterium]